MPKVKDGSDEAVKMTIFIKPSVIERLRVESRAESRVPGRHAGIVIERYLDNTVPPEVIYCPKCFVCMPMDAKFCPSCGEKIEANDGK